jgi:transposase-like protein
MTHDDVLFGYRLHRFALAGEVGVSEACRLMGVHRSTYYRRKHQVDRQGLEMLRPRAHGPADAQSDHGLQIRRASDCPRDDRTSSSPPRP